MWYNDVKYAAWMNFCRAVTTLFFLLFLPPVAMAYEEPSFTVLHKAQSYEIRLYAPRLAAQVTYTGENGGFRKLFNYISGDNMAAREIAMTTPVAQSKKINMTAPVTQSRTGDGKQGSRNQTGGEVMRFFLPAEFTIDNAPRPTDPDVSIVALPAATFAVIRYSGRASDRNFNRHRTTLQRQLEEDGILITGPAIKATYNGPFTLPFLRRNEAMFPVSWAE